jgi:hypothetical protein
MGGFNLCLSTPYGNRTEKEKGKNCKIKTHLTQRAGDLGYAPRFLAFCAALRFFRFGSESKLPPQAPNAHRWAPGEIP